MVNLTNFYLIGGCGCPYDECDNNGDCLPDAWLCDGATDCLGNELDEQAWVCDIFGM